MTPQEVLAQALVKVNDDDPWGNASKVVAVGAYDLAASILAALPEGWVLMREHHRCPSCEEAMATREDWLERGAQQERERLRKEVEALKRPHPIPPPYPAAGMVYMWNDALSAVVKRLEDRP